MGDIFSSKPQRTGASLVLEYTGARRGVPVGLLTQGALCRWPRWNGTNTPLSPGGPPATLPLPTVSRRCLP